MIYCLQVKIMNIFLDANGKKHIKPDKEPIYWRLSGYALVEYQNKFLTVIPTWNTLYELPGGGIEPDENIKQGIIRETWEETGYKIEITKKMPIYLSEEKFYHRHDKKFYHSLVIIYTAEIVSNIQDTKTINSVDGNEIASIKWQPLSDFTKENTHPIIYPVFNKLQSSSSTI